MQRCVISFSLAPAGIEPEHSGPGRSVWLLKTPGKHKGDAAVLADTVQIGSFLPVQLVLVTEEAPTGFKRVSALFYRR